MTTTPEKAPLWKLWEVSVNGYPPFTTVAPSRAKAMSEAWHNMVDCGWRNSSFREFLRITSCRRHWNESPHTYEGVKRDYGVAVQAGQRIALVNEGSSSGRLGTVQYPRYSSSSRVDVLLDEAQDHIVVVHPQSIFVLDEERERTIGGYRVYCPYPHRHFDKEEKATRIARDAAMRDGKKLMILLSTDHLRRDGLDIHQKGDPVRGDHLAHPYWIRDGDVVLFQTGSGTMILKDEFVHL